MVKKVLVSIALVICIASGAHAATLDLPDDGREVFTAEPLEAGQWYQIIIAGTKMLRWHSQVAEADILYTADGDGNFRNRTLRRTARPRTRLRGPGASSLRLSRAG